MCGIAGIIQKNISADENLLSSMLACLSHRGPDDEGKWQSKDRKVALGHRRLSIIDLTSGGHQPMVSPDGNYAVTFNGEIYNYQELKTELEKFGWTFLTKSDTEVLLYAYIQWKEKCLEKFNGMFAFAIWDQKKEILFAARDRLGEKPFKFYYNGDKFIFASEIKAILKDPAVSREIDWQAVDYALSFRFVPAPLTGFKNIQKLPAGHYLTWSRGGVQINKYWDPAQKKSADADEINLKSRLWELFSDSVKKRLISDVPLGAFLSGGIDSTSVVAAVTEVAARPLETFVVSLNGEGEDCRYAALAAKRFNTNHHEITLFDINLPQAIGELAGAYDEPFFDQSALPSFLISREMKKRVTVVLSGDGADELFGGYSAYGFIKLLETYQKLPAFIYKKLIPAFISFSNGAKYRAEILSKEFFSSYTEYFSMWKQSLPKSKRYITKENLYSMELKNNLFVSASGLMADWFKGYGKDVVNGAMIADIRGRLADGYLPKVDFASMNSAVEVRPPFLDHRLVELAAQINSNLKIKGTGKKIIWKEVVANKIPKEILNRTKTGFALPLNEILEKSARPLLEEALFSESSRLYPHFSKQTVKKLWQDHLNRRADYSNHLWSLLMLELWIRKYVK